jgi:hypothetical protein
MSHLMAHLADKAHRAHLDKQTVARVNSAVMMGVIGGGLVACASGAFIYDVGRWFSVW